MPISELPTPPSSTDPANFAVRTDVFLAALLALPPEMNAAVSEVNSAAQSATIAAAAAVNSPWVPGALQTVSGTSVTAVAGSHYILSNVAATTVTLPAAPAEGDAVWVTAVNGLGTNVAARNGKTIMGLAEDLTIDIPNKAVSLRYINTTWRILQ